jgi:AcrR family transcriptional regulator
LKNQTITKLTTSVGIKENATTNLLTSVGLTGEKTMNVKNNKRRRDSQDKIEKAFIELLQTREIKDITVSDIIKNTGLNRSTFYANYIDIFDLADKTREKLENDFSNLFADYDYFNERSGALKMFTHIKENQIFYKTYFKLCYDDKHLISIYDTRRAEKEHMDSNIKYHIEFFRNGLNAIIKLWLAGGCQESPEEMAEVLKQEYRGR